jgi:hypothetical protein
VAESIFTVRYQYATYSGTRTVTADDGEQAIAKVKAQIRREGALPMAYESYRIVSEVPRG